MMLFISILLALFYNHPPTNSYQAIVVDATTSRPLASVTVVNLQSQAASTTDQQGRFTLPGPIAHFRLSSLGFASLEVTRPTLASGQVDTLRLLPEAVLLPEVSVRPSKPLVLSSLGTKVTKPHGYIVVPGTQYGILFRPAANTPPAIVQQISVRFQPNRQPIAGRIRVRLVAPERGSSTTPSAHDLVPVAATYTAAQLAALPDHLLTVDLSLYNIRMPATGFFVLIEGLPTRADETYVTMGIMGGKLRGQGMPSIITASDPKNADTFHETPATDFPAVAVATSVTDVETVTRLGYSKPWTIKRVARKPEKSENVDISLTLLAE